MLAGELERELGDGAAVTFAKCGGLGEEGAFPRVGGMPVGDFTAGQKTTRERRGVDHADVFGAAWLDEFEPAGVAEAVMIVS